MFSNNKKNKNDILFSTKYNNSDPTNFYDIIIDFDSLKMGCEEKGFNVLFSENGYKNYEIQKKKHAIMIGVLGNANKGKSYILSKIAHEKLPIGYSIPTKGISVKYPKIENKPLIILDSAGNETPLIKNSDFKNINLSNNNEGIELISELFRDKIATQNFLQEFIYNYSDILIIIVGQLTNDEQKLINRIKLIYGNKKTIFIIHNLMFIETIKNVETIIENIIKKSITFNKLKEVKMINVVDDTKNQNYYLESKNKINIVHLIMAREGSEAGNYYNQNTILFLRKQIKSYIKDQRFDVIKSFRQHLSISSGTYMEKPIEINNVEYDEEKKKIVIKSNDKIMFKKYYEDELGITNFYGNIIEPYYNYDIYDDKIKINIELPGIIIKFHAKLILLNGNYVLIYFGNYKIPEEIKDMELLYNNIQYGEFRLQIKIPITFGTIKDSTPKHTRNAKNGEITLIYYLNKKEDNEVMMDL